MVEITWLPQGLHETPDALRQETAKAMEMLYGEIETGRVRYAPDAIALGYGLCSNGVLGLESREIPLIVPKTDDCIAMFLGSQKRYLETFETHAGTYWLNNGWVETSTGLPEEWRAWREKRYCEYCRQFDEDNAEYLMEMEDAWKHNYSSCGYITSPVHENPAYEEAARTMARENGWKFETIEGDLRLLKKLIYGEWNDDEFCICPPHHRLVAAYDGGKMRAEPLTGESA